MIARVSIAVFFCALAGFACRSDEPPTSQAPAGSLPKAAPSATAARVEVAALASSKAADKFVRPGEVEGAKEAALAAALGGFVERVHVKTGAKVVKNQPIAWVDASTYRAQLELAQVELDDAKRELARLQQMGNSVAQARVDAALTRQKRALAQVRLAQTQASRTTIRAPFAGVVVDLQVEQGEVVAPGAPVGRVLILDPVLVSVSVTDRDVGVVTVGDGAWVTSVGNQTPIRGVIARIEPAADLNTRTFLVEVEVANSQKRLLPGMIASVEFRPDAEQSRLLLPQEFLVTQLETNGVFVVAPQNKAQWRPLKLGDIVGDLIEVKDGLKEGETIVTTGHRALADGDSLLIDRVGKCCVDGRLEYPISETPK